MNLGLSQKLKVAFSYVVPINRPIVKTPDNFNPFWLAGFTSAEGCFLIMLSKSKTKIGYRVQLVFQLSQHSRDYELMKMFIIYLGCGYVIKDRDSYKFIVAKFKDIEEKIIPFFTRYPIQGVKAQDFNDFCLVAEMIKKKKHLLKEGLEQIKTLKAGINRGRKEY